MEVHRAGPGSPRGPASILIQHLRPFRPENTSPNLRRICNGSRHHRQSLQGVWIAIARESSSKSVLHSVSPAHYSRRCNVHPVT